MTSHSEQDYLLTIYRLGGAEAPVNTGTLAAHLSVAPASVTEMLGKLHREGFVYHVRYQGVTLSPQGTHEALRLPGRHRLWEVFLTKMLDLPWDQVHEEAHRLEHATSDRVADRLAQFLNEPAADPHGQLIPDRDGFFLNRPRVALADVEPGRVVQIVKVPDGDPVLLRRLGNLGLEPGAEVMIVTSRAADGPIAVRVGGSAVDLDTAAAGRIYVADAPRSGPLPPGHSGDN